MKLLSLREAREQVGLTQRELAQAAEMDQTTISRLETSRNANPTHRTIQRLAKALGIAPSKLQFTAPEPRRSVEHGRDRAGHGKRNRDADLVSTGGR